MLLVDAKLLGISAHLTYIHVLLWVSSGRRSYGRDKERIV
jgi:hypothetical protein